MADITKAEGDSTYLSRSKSRLIYPAEDIKSDSFMVVIHLPHFGYDDILVTIEPSSISLSATLHEEDRLLSLFDDSLAPEVYTTKVRIPRGLDIENADVVYDRGFVRVCMPYLK